MLVTTTAFGLTLMGGLWPFGGDSAESTEGTIRGLEPREIELEQAVVVDDGTALAREQYRMFLELSIDNPALQVEALRRLGDLNLKAGEIEDFDGTPDAAETYYREAVNLYAALLDANQDYAGVDRIMYQLSRAYEMIGENQQALSTLDQLVAEHPDSPFLAEAQFRRGEILFSDKRFDAAENAYAAVITVGDTSPYFEQSLYKHGWSLFKLGLHEECLDSFLSLLDLRLAGAQAGESPQLLSQMSRPERELVDDSFRVLSIALSYLDGYESLDAALDSRDSTHYADLLYAGLGNLYLDQERYDDAARTYAEFVAQNPAHSRSPALQVRVIEAYTLARFPSLVLEAKEVYVDLYGLDGEFWIGRDVADRPDVVSHLKQNLTDLAAYDHEKAQKNDDAAAYERAAGWYRRYLNDFPEDPDSAQRNFLLADILFELQRFDQAVAEYNHTAYQYGPHERAAEAAYAGIMAARRHEATLDDDARLAWRELTVSQSLYFSAAFPDHAQAAPVLTKIAEELFAAGDRQRAVDVAGLVITSQPPAHPDLERTAWTVVAHAQFDLQHYADAEVAYMRLQAMPMADGVQPEDIEARISASVFRQAEQAQAAGDNELAINEFLRVADVAPGSEFAPTAIYDAAALLIGGEQWSAAVDVLEDFRSRFPAHSLNDEVTQKLAVVRQSAGQTQQAAAEFERIAVLASVDPDIQQEALWQAAELYEQSESLTDQRRVYREIVDRYPAPFAESIEARQRLADLARTADDYADRRVWLESIIAVDAAAAGARTDRSRTLAARASLEMAATHRDAFVAVKLTAPLKDSLKLKKSRMEVALSAYGATADYGVAEVTTAATYEIAELYYRLSQDLFESERPASLTAEELEQYDILLEEQAFPFEEQAIDLYGANANRTIDGIYDTWVRKSFVRLAELMPARYAKIERSEINVASID